MSTGLDCFRRVALLSLISIVSACGRQSERLVLQPVRQLTTMGSSAQSTSWPEPISTTSVPHQKAPTQQIAMEFTRLISVRLQCGRRPGWCPINQLTAPDSEYRRYLASLMKIRADGNLVTRSGAGKFRFRIDSIELIGTSSAVVHTCIFDSLVVSDAGQLESTRDDIVFDDDVISGHTAWQVVVDDGKWKWSDAVSTDMNYGKDVCGFAS